MTVKTGAAAAGSFCTVDGTGELTAATGDPVGVLYVAGVANGAAVTITGANPYKWAVTCPVLTAGQVVQMYITATVDAIATGGFVWADIADTALSSDLAASLVTIVGADGDTLETLSDQIDGVCSLGVGAITWTYTLTSSVDAAPIPDADVWVTSDIAGTAVLASGRTNALGVVTFYLDAGTVYVFRQKSGWNFTNPDTEVVS